MIDLLPCPFCGEDPDISTMGSCIDIECGNCGISMSEQKCDLMTIDERMQFSDYFMDHHVYPKDVEQRLLLWCANRWNTRHG